MAKNKRMLNCGFVNASSFKIKTSNKAKLLYFYLIANADDKGFVDNVDEIIELLDSNDRKFDGRQESVLVESNYSTALKELMEKGMIISFIDNHDNAIYLIRHWYLHNQIPKDRIRNSAYERFLEHFEVNKDGEYVKQVSYNCNTDVDVKEIKLNKTKRNKNNISNKNDKSLENVGAKQPNDNENWEDDWERIQNELNSPTPEEENKESN